MADPRFLTIETQYVSLAGTVIDLLTAVVVAFHVGWAIVLILRGRGTEIARAVAADGVIAGLGFGVAGSLLKTIALQDWPHIRAFAFLFVFRTLLKRVFEREQQAITRRAPPPSITAAKPAIAHSGR